MQIRDVAHVDRAEGGPRESGNRAVHQALHNQDRRRVVGPKHRSERTDRIDGREPMNPDPPVTSIVLIGA